MPRLFPALERNLQQFRRQLGDEDRDTLRSLNNLAVAYVSDGQYDKGLPLLVDCLELRRKAFGPIDEDTLVSEINLAQAYAAAGRGNEAAKSYLDDGLAQRISDGLGPKNTHALAFLNNKAVFLFKRGYVAQVLPLFRNLLPLHREVFGADHVWTLELMHNLGRCLQSQGELDEAESLYREILQRVGDSNSVVQVREWKALQSVQLQQRQYDQALQTIDLWQQAVTDDPTDTALAQLSRTEALLGLGRAADALVILQSVLRPAENFSEFEAQRAQSLLGSAQSQLTGDDEAVAHMLQAFEWLRTELPRLRPHYRWYTPRSAERVLEYYRDQGDAKAVAKWEQVLVDVKAEIERLLDRPPNS